MIHQILQSRKRCFASDNSRQHENRPRWIIRMDRHFYARRCRNRHHLFQKIPEIVPQFFAIDGLICSRAIRRCLCANPRTSYNALTIPVIPGIWRMFASVTGSSGPYQRKMNCKASSPEIFCGDYERTTFPGSAPLNLSPSMTGTPFTSTNGIPEGYCCECWNVALSVTVAGSKMVISA